MNLIARIRDSQFLRFAVVGGTGFFVNEAVLFAAIRFLRAGPHTGWIVAFLVTVTYTWWGNRKLTFRSDAARGGRAVALEWARFVMANALGALVNYAIYEALITFAGAPLNSPYIALACGTLAGLLFNFTLSKRLVFRAPPA